MIRVPNLRQCQLVSFAVDDNFIRTSFHLLFDKSQKVLLVHARRGVDVSINLWTIKNLIMKSQ